MGARLVDGQVWPLAAEAWTPQVRRARRIDELTKDPRFPYHVGQLIGAVEMAAFILIHGEDEHLRRLGQKLGEAGNWFFTDDNTEGFGWTKEERS